MISPSLLNLVDIVSLSPFDNCWEYLDASLQDLHLAEASVLLAEDN